MQRLRRQVDQIDLRMLRLLQQRNKLTGEIGRIKRRHRAVIYVPERERELLSRLVRLSKGRIPTNVVTAIYREILSGSRAAQGQPPIGLFGKEKSNVLGAAKSIFGAADRFAAQNSWDALAKGVKNRALSLGLVTGSDLLAALRKEPSWKDFARNLTVANAVPIATGLKVGTDAVLTITPPGSDAKKKANRFVILIECKSTRNAIKTLSRAMPFLSLHDEASTPRSARAVLSLACLHAQRPVDATRTSRRLQKEADSAGVPLLVLGSYMANENNEVYGG
jgi:chorismate mutase